MSQLCVDLAALSQMICYLCNSCVLFLFPIDSSLAPTEDAEVVKCPSVIVKSPLRVVEIDCFGNCSKDLVILHKQREHA